jgi:hypothetical protein
MTPDASIIEAVGGEVAWLNCYEPFQIFRWFNRRNRPLEQFAQPKSELGHCFNVAERGGFEPPEPQGLT